MAVIRVHKNENYTVMSNHHLREKEMSLKAKGIMSLMLSLPEEWNYSIEGLATLSKDGKDSVMVALQELETFGYLTRTRNTDEKGRFKGYEYDIYEEPIKEKPYSEKPNTDNPTQININKINKEEIIEEIEKVDKRAEAPSPLSPITPLKESPEGLTKDLVRTGYIKEDDIDITDYNVFLRTMVTNYGFEIIRSCVWYFANRYAKSNGYDENGNKIIDKKAYFTKSIEEGAETIRKRNKGEIW